jgi:hypothetical protein
LFFSSSSKKVGFQSSSVMKIVGDSVVFESSVGPPVDTTGDVLGLEDVVLDSLVGPPVDTTGDALGLEDGTCDGLFDGMIDGEALSSP